MPIATIATYAQKAAQNILPVTRRQNFGEWYRTVIEKAQLAESSAVRGCMVIRPWGYGIWEQIQRQMDDLFKREKYCQNAYFPLLIPVNFFEKEATHVAGFAKECAVVTHYRMKIDEKGKMVPDPEAKLGKALVIRPTSETIIGDSMSKWIRSHRDLPLKLNQWCNVLRWEYRATPLFLRTAEFLWQEGHCAFARETEARANAYHMSQVYRTFMAQVCALPVILGEKTPIERFAGADQTYCLEAMVQDGNGVQAGTSHYLGTHFSKASNIQFDDIDGQKKFCHTTSWGVSTRLVGTLIMTHSDDDGLRIPPRLAPTHVVIIPSGYKNKEQRDAYISSIEELFKGARFFDRDIVVDVDTREVQAGIKKYEWIQKGVPIRFEIGAAEAESAIATVYRRDANHAQRAIIKIESIVPYVIKTLEEIQTNYHRRAKEFLANHINTRIATLEELQCYYNDARSIGFVRAKWAGPEDEEARKAEETLKKTHKLTIRCIPKNQTGEEGRCILTGKPATLDILLGKSY